MNSLLIYSDEIIGLGKAAIRGARAGVVAKEHGLRLGIQVTASVYGVGLGRARVVSVSEGLIEIDYEVTNPPPSRYPYHVVVAVPRPQTVKKVLQLCATFGVERISFVGADRTQKSYLQSTGLLPENIKEELRRGLEQAKDCVAPEVNIFKSVRHLSSVDFAKKRPEEDQGLRMLADTTEGPGIEGRRVVKGLAELAKGGWSHTSVTLAIGPESGWSDEERSVFAADGFIGVSLGERIFRVENALCLMLGQLGFCCAET